MTFAGSPPQGRTRLSGVAAGDVAVHVSGVALVELPQVTDPRGSLTFGEFPSHLPFVPMRIFMVSDVPGRKIRGEHAHRELHQLLICAHGEVTVVVDDGTATQELVLDRPDVGLHLAPMVWGTQHEFSADCVMIVMASDVYDADDYIRDHDEFLAAVRGG